MPRQFASYWNRSDGKSRSGRARDVDNADDSSLRGAAAMKLNLFIGAALSKARERMLASAYFPPSRCYPYGVSWLYDLMRIEGTRSFDTVFDVGGNRGQTVEILLRPP